MSAAKGWEALRRMLDMIGDTDLTDHDLAEVFCDAEMDIRALSAAPEPEPEPEPTCKEIGAHDWKCKRARNWKCRRCDVRHYGPMTELPTP